MEAHLQHSISNEYHSVKKKIYAFVVEHFHFNQLIGLLNEANRNTLKLKTSVKNSYEIKIIHDSQL